MELSSKIDSCKLKCRIWTDNGSLFRKFLAGVLQGILIIYKIYHLKSDVPKFSCSIFSD